MADEKYTFEQARIRLEEIAVEVRKKDTSLEKSLDLLEEGVRLANICTELVDHTDVSASVVVEVPDQALQDEAAASDEAGDAGQPEGEATEEPSGEVDGPGATAGDGDLDGFDETDDGVDEQLDAETDD